ncbi:FkbM family methyltransferase [Candidatus Nomurabacteria bacterium]|nr:FkbM family methyltransferase [Candidatus Nomurabacteria bacterium]
MLSEKITLMKMCYTLGSNPYMWGKLLLFSIWVRAFKHWQASGYGWKFSVKKFGKVVQLYLKDLSDYFVFKELFFEDDYGHDFEVGDECIIDIGANNGLSALYFSLKYPKSKIYACEPDPRTFMRLVANALGSEHIIPLQLAVSDQNGFLTFYSTPRAISSSQVKRNDQAREVSVPSQTLDTLLESIGERVGLLKIDVEGAEQPIVEAWINKDRVNNIVGEFHQDLVNVDKETFFSWLDTFELETFERGPKRTVFYGKTR